jgi:hypothetical protein
VIANRNKPRPRTFPDEHRILHAGQDCPFVRTDEAIDRSHTGVAGTSRGKFRTIRDTGAVGD